MSGPGEVVYVTPRVNCTRNDTQPSWGGLQLLLIYVKATKPRQEQHIPLLKLPPYVMYLDFLFKFSQVSVQSGSHRVVGMFLIIVVYSQVLCFLPQRSQF